MTVITAALESLALPKQYLDGFLVDFEVASAQFLEGSVGILSVHHDNVGTSSGRNHLRGVEGEKVTLQVTHSEQHTNAQLQQAGTSGGAPKGAMEGNVSFRKLEIHISSKLKLPHFLKPSKTLKYS